jgi:hypothetical protein
MAQPEAGAVGRAAGLATAAITVGLVGVRLSQDLSLFNDAASGVTFASALLVTEAVVLLPALAIAVWLFYCARDFRSRGPGFRVAAAFSFAAWSVLATLGAVLAAAPILPYGLILAALASLIATLSIAVGSMREPRGRSAGS